MFSYSDTGCTPHCWAMDILACFLSGPVWPLSVSLSVSYGYLHTPMLMSCAHLETGGGPHAPLSDAYGDSHSRLCLPQRGGVWRNLGGSLDGSSVSPSSGLFGALGPSGNSRWVHRRCPAFPKKSWALYGGVRWPAAGGCWWSWPVAGLGRLSGSSFLYDRAMQGLVGN